MSDFDEATERALYEKHGCPMWMPKNRHTDGIYAVPDMNSRWKTWLAARRLSHDENARLREALTRCAAFVRNWIPEGATPMGAQFSKMLDEIEDALAPKKVNDEPKP